MASVLQIKFGQITSDPVPLGAAPDAVLGAKVKEWAMGNGIAAPEDTNKQVADKVAAWLVRQWREQVKEWHVANERTQFERTSREMGGAFLDVE